MVKCNILHSEDTFIHNLCLVSINLYIFCLWYAFRNGDVKKRNKETIVFNGFEGMRTY